MARRVDSRARRAIVGLSSRPVVLALVIRARRPNARPRSDDAMRAHLESRFIHPRATDAPFRFVDAMGWDA